MNFRPVLMCAVALLVLHAHAQPPAGAPTGSALPGLERVDATMMSLMAKYDCPGAQLAVTRHGRLVLAHGYGFADRETRALVQPDSLFRIASLSKLITSIAIFRLVEQHKLSLDAPAFALVPQITPLPGAKVDPRLARITIRHLLQHTGGWDRDASGDPMFKSIEIATATQTEAPAGAEAIIRFMLGRPLDFEPGTKYVYSNFGYNVLGRIIEQVSGQSYGDFVQANLFTKAGATHLLLGRTFAADRAPGEVTYYDYPSASRSNSVFPPLRQRVAAPYGGFNLEAMDAHGAWLANAIDYVRLLSALDGSRRPALLSGTSLETMTARPASPVSVDAPAYYACGLQVRPIRGATSTGANWWHGGSLPGTITYQVRLANGWSWAAFFNSRPKESRPFTAEIDKSINAALIASTPPETGDLFESR